MTILADQPLQACGQSSTALSENEIQPLMQQLTGWELLSMDGTAQITKTYRFTDFIGAHVFSNKVAQLAEMENHHPRICVEWGKTTISWWTHSVQGLFINDFIMAARCDAAYFE